MSRQGPRKGRRRSTRGETPIKGRLRGGRKVWAKGLRSEVYGDLGVFVLGYAMATAVGYVWNFFFWDPGHHDLRGSLVGIPLGFSAGILVGVVPALVFHLGSLAHRVPTGNTLVGHRRSWCLIAGLFSGGQLFVFPDDPPLILIWGGLPLVLGFLGSMLLPPKVQA